MNDDDLVLIDECKSLQWNYVNRVERELSLNNDYQSITMNPLLPRSYKDVVMCLSRACNHSRVSLLIDDNEEFVAFMLVVDADCIPFLLEGLDDVVMPMKCVYKVFKDDLLAKSTVEDGMLQEFIYSTVIPDLNSDFGSWKKFDVMTD